MGLQCARSAQWALIPAEMCEYITRLFKMYDSELKYHSGLEVLVASFPGSPTAQ